MATSAEKDNWYSYHPPTTGQAAAYVELRNKAREFADLFDRYAPPSADATAAHRKLRETVMAMNQAIACNGMVGDGTRRDA